MGLFATIKDFKALAHRVCCLAKAVKALDFLTTTTTTTTTTTSSTTTTTTTP